MAELFHLLRGFGGVMQYTGIGQRWLAAIEGMDGGRLRRGRSYSRSGHVTNVTFTDEGVLARVRGSSYTPYQVRLSLPAVPPAIWEQVLEVVASDATTVAAVLGGQIPAEIERTLAAHGQELFPASLLDSEDDCTCYDWSRPCKHIAAVYYVLADVLEGDPHLIFTLRGLPKEHLIERLEAIRERLLAERFGSEDEAEEAAESQTEEQAEDFWSPGLPLDSIPIRADPPGLHAAPLKALGPAPYGYDRREFTAKAEQMYAAISQAGLRLLIAQANNTPAPPIGPSVLDTLAELPERRRQPPRRW